MMQMFQVKESENMVKCVAALEIVFETYLLSFFKISSISFKWFGFSLTISCDLCVISFVSDSNSLKEVFAKIVLSLT